MQKPSEEDFEQSRIWAETADEKVGWGIWRTAARVLLYLLAERKVLREVAAASQPIIDPTEEQMAEATGRALLALDALYAFYREHGGAP